MSTDAAATATTTIPRPPSGTHTSVLGPEPIVDAALRPDPRGTLVVYPRTPESAERAAFCAQTVRAAGLRVADDVDQHTTALVWVDPHPQHIHVLQSLLETHPAIKWIQMPMAGVNAFSDLITSDLGKRRLWTSAKGAYAQPVAEHALALALATLRVFPARVKATAWGPAAGSSLFGARVLIVGAGGIALSLLALLQPFNVKPVVLRRSKEPLPTHPAVEVDSFTTLDAHLPRADLVFIAAAATAETHKMFNKHAFTLLPKHAVVVNVARGLLVDSDALHWALQTGEIAGAGLDVTDPEPLPESHPLWKLGTHPDSNLIITPHTADTPEMILPLLSERITANVQATVRGDGKFVGRISTDTGY